VRWRTVRLKGGRYIRVAVVRKKGKRGGRTVAVVHELSGSERVAEIARMLAGEKVPETAVKHARGLLDAAGK